jgi:DNA-binding transcriptional LysR family regulator
MAIESFGVTRVLSYQVTEAIERGRLKAILTDFEPEPIPIHLLHTGGRGPSAKVRSFVDFAVEKLRASRALHGDARSRLAHRP